MATLRAIFGHARRMGIVESQGRHSTSSHLFPADSDEGHFAGFVRVLERVCAGAGLSEFTPHTLRHTFTSVAGGLNFSELAIRGQSGQAGQGVTQRHVHPDRAPAMAADKTAGHVARPC